MRPVDNPNLEPVPDDEPVPYTSPHGWFRTKGHPVTRIEGSAWISDDARITGGVIYGNARISSGARISGGEIYGDAWISSGARIAGGEISGGAWISGGEIFGGVIAGGARIYGGVIFGGKISGGEIHGGVIAGGEISGGEIFCGVISGGTLVGIGIHAVAVRWVASLCAPGVVKIGCEEHPISDWLADDPPCERIPWAEHVTEDERKAIQATIRGMALQEALGKTWAEEEKESDA